MFTPIENARDLPPEKHSTEGRALDFKQSPTADRFEMAKDVAAFANASGGTILVGAKGRGEFLGSYVPISSKDASACMRAYDESVRDRCSPHPMAIPRAIKYGDGDGVIVAVNVWPFPGQAVGVEVKKTETKCGTDGKEIEGLHYFPVRVGGHTTSISPEQLSMFFDPRARRTAIALQPFIGRTIVVFSRRRDGEEIWMEEAALQSVDLFANAVVVTMTHNNERVGLSIPLDLIECAWREGEVGRLLLRGRVRPLQWIPDARLPVLTAVRLFVDPF